MIRARRYLAAATLWGTFVSSAVNASDGRDQLNKIIESLEQCGAGVAISAPGRSGAVISVNLSSEEAIDEKRIALFLESLGQLGAELERQSAGAGRLLGDSYYALSLEGAGISNRALTHVAGLKRLRELDISRCPITDAGLGVMKDLRRLRLDQTDITDSGLFHLAKSQSLTRLEIYENKGFTGVGLRSFRSFELFTTLAIVGCDLTDEGLSVIGQLHALRSLGIHRSSVTDAGLAHLQDLARLQTVELSLNKISGAGLRALKQIKSLSAVRIQDEDLSRGGLEGLAPLVGLKELVLIRTELGDNDLPPIGRLRSLRTLRLLENPLVTAVGLLRVAPLPELTYLELSGEGVSDEVLGWVAQLGSLGTLRLVDTSVSDKGIKELQSKTKKPPVVEKVVYPGGRVLHLLGRAARSRQSAQQREEIGTLTVGRILGELIGSGPGFQNVHDVAPKRSNAGRQTVQD